MWDQVSQLYAYHEDVPAEVRLLKLTEEVGGAGVGQPGELIAPFPAADQLGEPVL